MNRLLIRPGAIGDFVVSLPALESLRADYTEVWCAEQNVPLARFADRAISIGASGLDRIGILPAEDVIERLRGFDEIWSWYGAARSEFHHAVSGLPFRFFPAIPPANAGCSASAFFCAQISARDRLPKIDAGYQPRQDFIILHPFASSPAKRWPMRRFQQLAAALHQTRWCAGPEEPLEGAVRVPNLFGLAQWISTARAYVGNDSGITHLAAAVGTPVVALFGPSDPVIWAPRGENVRILSSTSLPLISVDQVLAALASLL